MKTKDKNKNYKYNFGSFVKTQGANVGALTGIAGQAIGGSAGNVLSGIGSGIAAGSALGPPGMIAGALLGLGGSLLGNRSQKRAAQKAEKEQTLAYNTSYEANMKQGLDTNNENPYGDLVFKDGGGVGSNPFLDNLNPKSSSREIYRPLPLKPQKESLKVSDNRTKSATSNKKINPNKDLLGGNYDTERINKIVQYAKLYGHNPYDLIAIDLQETKLGKTGLDNEAKRSLNVSKNQRKDSPGHLIMSEEDMTVKSKSGKYGDDWEYDDFARGYGTKVNAAKKAGLTSDVDIYQTFNGRGKVFPSTESDYHGYNMKQIYGVDIPTGGIDMKKNPLYGKRIKDIKENILMKSPEISDAVNNVYANGGMIGQNYINIEKGELQIDPESGKILREYDRINPETGGLYEKHSKGVDTKNNFVSAEEGTFIITKDKAKDYKKAIDTNDKLYQNSILQNIKNFKDREGLTKKFATGGLIPLPKTPNWTFDPTGINNLPGTGTLQNNIQGQGLNLGGALNTAVNYAPALLNIGKGLFGSVDRQAPVQAINNPYRNQVLNNMPQDISLNPLVNRINRNQTSQFRQIDNTTSSNPIARANKNNIFANTQNNLSDVYLQQQQLNNQIRGQRSNIYNQLGSQDMQEQARVQQLNLGINQQNQQNRAAKDNILNTGLSQLQQTYQNQSFNGQQKANDALRQKMLLEMFPNLRFYQETFGGQ